MTGAVTVNLAKPITSAGILDNYGTGIELPGHSGVSAGAGTEQIKSIQNLENHKAAFSQLCQTLKCLADKLNQFYDKVFAEHREQIARLSVEIARKILVQKIEEGDYEIESIVKEALENAPTRQDMVVRLNPEDLVQCQKVQQDDAGGALDDIKFVADSNIGRAECVLESPKGIIESLIDGHLEQIGKALVGKVKKETMR